MLRAIFEALREIEHRCGGTCRASFTVRGHGETGYSLIIRVSRNGRSRSFTVPEYRLYEGPGEAVDKYTIDRICADLTNGNKGFR